MKKAFLSLVSILVVTLTYAQSNFNQIDEFVSQSQITAHLEFLASDALKGRNTGSDGIEAAAAYLASYFRSCDIRSFEDYKDYRQKIPFTTYSPPATSLISVGDEELNFPTDFILLNGEKREMQSQIEYVGYATEEDLAGRDLRLKVVVSLCGDGVSQDAREWFQNSDSKRQRVIEAGAAGLIELYKNPSVPWQLIRSIGMRERMNIEDNNNVPHSMPHIWLNTQDTSITSRMMESGTNIQLQIEELVKTPSYSSNVVGWIPGTDPNLQDEYLVFTAHYDHVGIGRPDQSGDTIYNGARDNAVGATAVTMLAQYMSKYPAKRPVIFVLFTAEEKGLLGSQYFVDHSPVPLDQIKYCYNIDNGGYNDTTIVSVIGLTRTGAEQVILESSQSYGLTAIEDPAKEQGLFDRSDNVNFARRGIPAPTFSLGFRSFDAEIFKYYHQPGDEVESLNMNYIEKYVKSYLLSAVRIANMDSVPFWNSGDKYFEAGKLLYQDID